ncbi:MADS-box protein JOINTLESS, partial [Mucuna pruriens]
LGSDTFDMLLKEVEEKTHELSRLNGEELQGLTIQELQKLEELLQRRSITISKIKDEKIIQEINRLKTKEAELMEENQKMKQRFVQEQRQSYESITCSSSDFPPDYGSSDTSLKLGLPLFE